MDGPDSRFSLLYHDSSHYPSRRWTLHTVYPGRAWEPWYHYTRDNIPPLSAPTALERAAWRRAATLGHQVPPPPKASQPVQPMKLSPGDPAVNLQYPIRSYFLPWERSTG